MSATKIRDVSCSDCLDESSSFEEKSFPPNDSVVFWATDPNVILKQKYIFELFPVDTMTYNQKLNSVTRMIIILSIVTFIVTRNIRMIVISLLTIGSIFFLHKFHTEKTVRTHLKSGGNQNVSQEGFSEVVGELFNKMNRPIPENVFQAPTSVNPFANVMVSDYDYNPNKKPAGSSSNADVNSEIIIQAKRLVEEANPGQPDISNKLFKDLGEELKFEQSMRQFSSTPNTTIPNDQGAFADFCYGDMVSCKDGNLFACGRNMSRYNLI